MLSLLRHRALPLLRISTPAAAPCSSLRISLRSLSSTAPGAFHFRTNVHLKCKPLNEILTESSLAGLGRHHVGRREGHLHKNDKEPTICAACGHQRCDCPIRDVKRLQALKIVVASSLLTVYLSPFIFIFGMQ
ncbi:hypothetical protein C8R44DRAFT_846199 [Mycena epipterygia]|nr:hypothetical protein C8R44DRAFT_846199 [Mycena epipterygia]